MPETYDYWLGAAELMLGMQYYRKPKKTKEDLARELEALRKECDDRVDMHILERKIYVLTVSIASLESDIEMSNQFMLSLEGMSSSARESPYWAVNSTLIATRLGASQAQLEKEKKELEELTQQLKEYSFAQSRKGIDEEIKELEEEEKIQVVDNTGGESPQPTGDTT